MPRKTTTKSKDKNRTLDDLSPTKFEEFCFDILGALGYVNVQWRKGTGHNSSPSDGGRDIECDLPRELPGGRQELEHWIVECKHGKTAIPKERLAGFLAAAMSLRPDRALIIASSFLSTAAHDWLAEWKRENRPPFQLDTWERKDLERAVSTRPLLLRKYGLAGAFPVLEIMHPAHIRYLTLPAPNSLDFLFAILDAIEPVERSGFLSSTQFHVVNPRFSDPPPGYKGTLGDLMVETCSYEVFKRRCYELARHTSELFVVKSVVNDTLQYLLHLGNVAAMETFDLRYKDTLSFLRKRMAACKDDRKELEDAIHHMERMQAEAPASLKAGYRRYVAFCERVVSRLSEERIEANFPLAVRRMMRDIE